MRSQLNIRGGTTSVVFLAVVVGLVSLLATASACPDGLQCHQQNDCPIGEVCNAKGTCVGAPDAGGIDPFDGGPNPGEGEGEGEGEGDDEQVVQLDGPVSMLQADPRDPNLAILGLYDGTGAIDETFNFTLADGTVGDDPEFDFITLNRGNCNIDTITEVTGADVGQNNLPPNAHQDELWFSCDQRFDLVYGTDVDAFAGSSNFTGHQLPSIPEVVRFLKPAVDDNAGPNARIVYAKRGDAALNILELDPQRDQELAVPAFLTESFSDGTAFEHITQIFVLRSGDRDFGDVLLVFDRKAAGPELVPIQREFGELTWHGPPITNASLDVDVLPLPTDTHAVIFREDVPVDLAALAFDDADRDVATLVALRPTNATQGTGLVTFARYEAELLVHPAAAAFGQESHFIDLQLQSSDATALPPPGDKLLLETRLDPNTNDIDVFYALTASNHAWRFPIHSDRNDDNVDDVARVQFINQNQDKPNGMVLIPGDLDHAWFSFGAGPSRSEVHKLLFDPDFQ